TPPSVAPPTILQVETNMARDRAITIIPFSSLVFSFLVINQAEMSTATNDAAHSPRVRLKTRLAIVGTNKSQPTRRCRKDVRATYRLTRTTSTKIASRLIVRRSSAPDPPPSKKDRIPLRSAHETCTHSYHNMVSKLEARASSKKSHQALQP